MWQFGGYSWIVKWLENGCAKTVLPFVHGPIGLLGFCDGPDLEIFAPSALTESLLANENLNSSVENLHRVVSDEYLLGITYPAVKIDDAKRPEYNGHFKILARVNPFAKGRLVEILSPILDTMIIF